MWFSRQHSFCFLHPSRYSQFASHDVTSLSLLADSKPKAQVSLLPGSSRVAYVALSSLNSALPAAVDTNANKRTFIAKPFKPWLQELASTLLQEWHNYHMQGCSS